MKQRKPLEEPQDKSILPNVSDQDIDAIDARISVMSQQMPIDEENSPAYSYQQLFHVDPASFAFDASMPWSNSMWINTTSNISPQDLQNYQSIVEGSLANRQAQNQQLGAQQTQGQEARTGRRRDYYSDMIRNMMRREGR